MISLGPFETIDALVNAAIDLLRREGFQVVAASDAWETPGKTRMRLGIKAATFSNLLRAPDCPAFQAIRGASGRILKLKCNPVLEGWLIERASSIAFGAAA